MSGEGTTMSAYRSNLGFWLALGASGVALAAAMPAAAQDTAGVTGEATQVGESWLRPGGGTRR